MPCRAGRQIFLFVFPKSCIYFFLWLQRVPLGNGPPGVGQHVGPVPQLRAGGVAAREDLADGFVLPQLVIVQHRDDHLHFLKEETFFRGVERRSGRDCSMASMLPPTPGWLGREPQRSPKAEPCHGLFWGRVPSMPIASTSFPEEPRLAEP